MEPFANAMPCFFGILKPLPGKLRVRTIVRTQQEKAQIERRESPLLDVIKRKHIAERFAHFLVRKIDSPFVHPVTHKWHAERAFALGNFAFVVGENVVLPSCMDIDPLAQEFDAHGRTLDVPPGESCGRILSCSAYTFS